MLRKLYILLYKDLLIILNDKAGLGYLFVMPVILVFIMVTIQDTSFKSISNLNIKVVIRNDDKDTVGNTIVNELRSSGYFKISEISKLDNSLSIEEMVTRNDFKIGIIIPDSTTIRLKQVMRKSRIAVLKETGKPDLEENDISNVQIYFTPLLSASNKIMILSLLRECGTRIESQMLMNRISLYIPSFRSSSIPGNIIKYSEASLKNRGSKIIPNSTQHNVPAWTLFAMFFIVMSLAGNMIKEREDRSFIRLRYMPFSMNLYLMSKLIIYFCVGMIQLILMLLMGIYILPLADFPALVINGRLFSILVIGSVSSLAAVGYGLLIGTITRTYQQASSFGAISVVILAAIGGVWVPVMAMPQFMQKISIISPLNWGVESFHKVLVANMSYTDCGQELIFLMLFFAICTLISMYYFKRKLLFEL
jgi:ABC-2 type transport system permease protein